MDQQAKTALFKQLTWDEIEEWAGPTIAASGNSYQRNHRATGLALTSTGEVIAWVQGTRRYATLIDINEDGLIADCSCPYVGICKHAVAVLLDYREHLKQQRELSTVSSADLRMHLLANSAGEARDEQDDKPVSLRAASPQHLFLEAQTKAQLIEIIEDLARRFPNVQATLEDRRTLTTGNAEQLMQDAHKLIATISIEPAWRNKWDDAGSIPDYEPVRERLELLLDQGHADEVVSLGETLLQAGIAQVEQSHDEGETVWQVRGCMDVVFRALPESSLEPSEQLLWVIDASLRDEYDLCEGGETVLEQPHTAKDWSVVADMLIQRLRDLPSSADRDDFSRVYARDKLSTWAITALQEAGREDEIIPLAEREAELNGAYVRLVELLIKAGHTGEAEQWITKGIAALGSRQLGTIHQLRDTLRELREQAGDWLHVAAMRAEEFFAQPSLTTLQSLRTAAEQVGAWPAVEGAAMYYLETGQPPQAKVRTVGKRTIPVWPLPATGLSQAKSQWQGQFPMINLLIAIAANERQPDQVLYWYDRLPTVRNFWSIVDEPLVADAIVDVYPERATAIWKKLAEAQIAQTQPSAYEIAVEYLRKLRDLFTRQGQTDEWRRYIAELRKANARKRKLVEMLDNLARQEL